MFKILLITLLLTTLLITQCLCSENNEYLNLLDISNEDQIFMKELDNVVVVYTTFFDSNNNEDLSDILMIKDITQKSKFYHFEGHLSLTEYVLFVDPIYYSVIKTNGLNNNVYKGWAVVLCPGAIDLFQTYRKIIPKFLPHLFFPEADYYFYMDKSITFSDLFIDPFYLIHDLMLIESNDLMVVADTSKVTESIMKRLLDVYEHKFTNFFCSINTTIIVRRNNEKCGIFSDLWFMYMVDLDIKPNNDQISYCWALNQFIPSYPDFSIGYLASGKHFDEFFVSTKKTELLSQSLIQKIVFLIIIFFSFIFLFC